MGAGGVRLMFDWSQVEAMLAEMSQQVPADFHDYERGVMETVLEEGKDACPVSDNATPGWEHLRDTYELEDDGTALAITTWKEYASYVEWGTSRMAARPHMVPALERHLDELGADTGISYSYQEGS